MAAARSTARGGRNGRSAAPASGGDGADRDAARVLTGLGQAEDAFHAFRADHERLAGELDEARAALAREQATTTRLEQRAEDASRRAEERRRLAEHEREHAADLARALKEVHQALFTGDVYDLVLRACARITGATRGVFVQALMPAPDPRTTPMRVRAILDVPGYRVGRDEPSAFMRSVAAAVLRAERGLVSDDDGARELPEPERAGERFRNWAAAPVTMLGAVAGVLVVANKTRGDFDGEDLDVLLSVGEQAAVALENGRLQRELTTAYVATITALADAVEAKDAYTRGHCERVAQYARAIAERMGLPPGQVGVAAYGALLHDVGKIAVSDGVLNKPGPLLPEERELVRCHPRVGFDMLRKVAVLEEMALAVLHHHEWWDGSGYPDGLKEDQIPLTARIVAVADAYGAMVDRRSYKEAFTDEQARAELRRGAGMQFDPMVVQAFLGALEEGDLAERDPWPDDLDPLCSILPWSTDVRAVGRAA